MLPVGKKRTRLTIQRPVDTQDASGGITTTWLDVHSCWAELEGLSGRERLQAQTAGALLSHRVRMDYVPGLLPTMRMVAGTRVFSIGAVLEPDQQRRVHECMVTEQLGV